MRNTTKLKLILQKFTVSLDLNDASFTLVLIDKSSNEMWEFEGPSYGSVLSKAYSHLLRSLKSSALE